MSIESEKLTCSGREILSVLTSIIEGTELSNPWRSDNSWDMLYCLFNNMDPDFRDALTLHIKVDEYGHSALSFSGFMKNREWEMPYRPCIELLGDHLRYHFNEQTAMDDQKHSPKMAAFDFEYPTHQMMTLITNDVSGYLMERL